MPEKKILAVDFTQKEVCAEILPRSPLISSYSANWDGIRLDYHRQPPHETPEHSPLQHIISISLEQRLVHTERVLNGRIHHESIAYGDVAVIPAKSYHKLRWESEAEFLLLSLENTLFSRVAYDSLDLQGMEIQPHFASSSPLIQQIGLALKSELENKGFGSALYIDSLTTTLCVHLLKHYSLSLNKSPLNPQGLSQIKLKQVIEYINDNLEKDLTLAELATLVDLSMYHFSRLFKQSTSFSPHQYVLNCRIEKAKKLLVKTEEAIDEICQQVGFQNQSHFTNVFRKLMGTTPKIYRKEAKM